MSYHPVEEDHEAHDRNHPTTSFVITVSQTGAEIVRTAPPDAESELQVGENGGEHSGIMTAESICEWNCFVSPADKALTTKDTKVHQGETAAVDPQSEAT